MNTKKIAAIILIFLGLFFSLPSMPFGAAISKGSLNRTATATVATDENALLKIIGFNNQSYNMNGSYTNFGTITNNSKNTIILTVTIIPNFTSNHTASRYGIKIGTTDNEFRLSTSSPKQVTVTMQPGQVITAQASLSQNALSSLTVDFQFSVESVDGSYKLQLKNSPQAPRRIICY